MIRRLALSIFAAIALFASGPVYADQTTLITPGAPLSMPGLATFLSNAHKTIATNYSGPTPPAVCAGGTVCTNQYWFDTSTTPGVLKIYDGSQWAVIGSLNASTHQFTIFGGLAIVSIADFGADPSGAVDACTTAIPAAIAKIPSSGGTLYIPLGNYTCSNRISFANKNIRVLGDGSGISVITFNSATADKAGIAVSQNSFTFQTEIRGLSLYTSADQINGNAGLSITYPSSLATNKTITIDDLEIAGTANNGHYWANGVTLANGVSTVISSFNIRGKNEGNPATGISASNMGSIFKLSGYSTAVYFGTGNANFANYGIEISGDSEGSVINGGQFIGVNYGVYLHDGAFGDGTSIAGAPGPFLGTGTNFATYKACFVAQGWNQIIATGVVCYRRPETTQDWIGVNLSNGTYSAVSYGSNQNKWSNGTFYMTSPAATAVDAASITNLTLSGPQTIDGYSAIAGNRVLAAGQTSAAANGVYLVAAGAWTRATDFPNAGSIAQGTRLQVTNGSTYGTKYFQVTNAGAVVGTTLTFGLSGYVKAFVTDTKSDGNDINNNFMQGMDYFLDTSNGNTANTLSSNRCAFFNALAGGWTINTTSTRTILYNNYPALCGSSSPTTALPTGATPSVGGLTQNEFFTNNGGAVTITNLLNGYTTQTIIIYSGDAGNTTIQNNGNILLQGGANITLAGVTDSVILRFEGNLWRQIGGTGNGYPISAANITAGTLLAVRGGTGFSSYAVGDLLYANTTTTLAKQADVAVGQVLVSGGVNTAPAYSATPALTSLSLGGAAIGSNALAVTGSAIISGNVGIGTASPLALLDVNGSLNVGGGNGSFFPFQVTAANKNGVLVNLTSSSASTNDTLLNVQGPAVTGSLTGLAVTATVSVRVSATVRNTGAGDSQMLVWAGSGGDAYFRLLSAQDWSVGSRRSTGNFTIANGATLAATNYLTISTTGAVSIPANIASISPTTGTLVVTGGVGVSGAANVGTFGTFASYLRVGSNSAPANTTAGDITGVRLFVGDSASSTRVASITSPITGGTSAVGLIVSGAVDGAVTTAATYFFSQASTAAGAGLATLQHFYANQGTLTATVAGQVGFWAASTLTGAGTYNYGFYGELAAASTVWNIYMGGSARNFMQGALSIGGTTDPGAGGLFVNGSVTLAGLGTDAAATDTTLCLLSTNVVAKGSGTLGICLGTSSARYKTNITGLDVGLSEIMRLQPVSYKLDAKHGDPTKVMYGFTAEQGIEVLPRLAGLDDNGRPNTFDYLGVVPVLVHAVQELKADNDNMKAEIEMILKRANGR